jgi:hypothetical protein
VISFIGGGIRSTWRKSLSKNKKLADAKCTLVTSQWFSSGTPISSTNKTNYHNITEILLTHTMQLKYPTLGDPKWKEFSNHILSL